MADQKKNISEYIIQMYRKEDLIRAFEFDLEKIGNHVINHLPVSNIEKLSQVNHYEELISQMQNQGIEKEGHLEQVNQLVHALENICDDLKTNDQQFAQIYDSALPHIEENIALSENKITSHIQICLNGIYGFLLLKLNGKKLDDQNQTKVEKFGEVLSYLSMRYREISGSN